MKEMGVPDYLTASVADACVTPGKYQSPPFQSLTCLSVKSQDNRVFDEQTVTT